MAYQQPANGTVNVGALPNALAVAIQQATTSSQSSQVGVNQSPVAQVRQRSCLFSRHEQLWTYSSSSA